MLNHVESGDSRSFFPGMGEAVAARTVVRTKENGEKENWGDVAERVAVGSSFLHPEIPEQGVEQRILAKLMRRGVILSSGRHLQHGDAEQPYRPMEVFTNCSTAIPSFLLYRLLLNGSGVGGDYSEAIRFVDYRKAPRLVPVIDGSHPDVAKGLASGFMSYRSARHMYRNKKIVYFRVPDSREGWAKCFQKFEVMAYQGIHHDKVLVCDFTDVRKNGDPIMGMQGRPASGPGLMMKALLAVQNICDAGAEPWEQAMFIDHFLAECVVVGGARRAARMATKTWRDKSVLRFIEIKRPVEYLGKSGEEILAIRKDRKAKGLPPFNSFLWTSNNSVLVDAECWAGYDKVELFRTSLPQGSTDDDLHGFLSDAIVEGQLTEMEVHAWRVIDRITFCQYFDGTGEPGIINVDKLNQNRRGLNAYAGGGYVNLGQEDDEETREYLSAVFRAAIRLNYVMITNPCGEIALSIFGGYCVTGDVVPFFAESDEEAVEAFRAMVRMLIRTNRMNCMYQKETERTNRIGVGMTGLHEFAFKRFGFGWKDLVNESVSLPFWQMLSEFKRAVQREAFEYSRKLGMAVPMTDTTMKPAGTTSKLFGLTEGAHLPGRREFLRWVQFREGDPLIAEYEAKGYPTRRLQSYSGTVIVGFPTRPVICALGMGDKLVTAPEATPEEQYEFLRLLEKYWMRGVDNCGNPLENDTGNQISYTLKYFPEKTDYATYRAVFSANQRTVKVCSVLPYEENSSYEYLPEESISAERFEEISAGIARVAEDIDRVHVDCEGGACPVDFNKPA